MNWHDIITTATTVILTGIAIGGVMFAMLKGFFKTVDSCEKEQTKCQANVCKKIDELKEEVKNNRDIVSSHYIEILKELRSTS